jgi:sugar lactone lactonase YvrE
MTSSSPNDPDIDEVLPVRALLGECPLWCQRTCRLYWIDIDGRVVHRTDPTTGQDDVRHLEVRPGSIALMADKNRLLVAAEHAIYELDWSTADLTPLRELEPDDSPTRMNDGRCDPAGRFWVGSMDDPAGTGAGAASLHCVSADLAASVVEREVAVSNALAFDRSRSIMYWADTPTGVIWSFDYHNETGTRAGRRVFIDFAGRLPGGPDGACIDAEGCLWVACVHGWGVARITPDGEVDRFIELPVQKPSMPAFGGDRLDTMFITSISSGGSRPAAPGQPLAGALLAIDVGQSGLPEPVFGGSSPESGR